MNKSETEGRTSNFLPYLTNKSAVTILPVSSKITFLSKEEILMKKSLKMKGNWLHPEVVDVDQTFFILILWNLEEARKCNLVFHFKELSQSQLHISTRFFFILSQIRKINAFSLKQVATTTQLHVLISPGPPRHLCVQLGYRPSPCKTTDGSKWDTYNFSLLEELLSRLGELVLQQERINAFIEITRDRVWLRHLYHALRTERKWLKCAGASWWRKQTTLWGDGRLLSIKILRIFRKLVTVLTVW